MKYIRKFNTEHEYNEFLGGGEYVEPHVVYVSDNTNIFFKSKPPKLIQLGDIAYWDGTSLKTCANENFNDSIGVAIGVVVIPEGLLPDGRARIISMKNVDKNGLPTDDMDGFTDIDIDIPLPPVSPFSVRREYNSIAITDNLSDKSEFVDNSGYLPSDKFLGETSFVDIKSKYSTMVTSKFAPSPYKDGKLNSEFSKLLDNGLNALSDFDGITNTIFLLNDNNVFAKAVSLYDDTYTNLEWYLPSVGEISFLFARYSTINNIVNNLPNENVFLSTLYGNNFYWALNTLFGHLSGTNGMGNKYAVRPFAML